MQPAGRRVPPRNAGGGGGAGGAPSPGVCARSSGTQKARCRDLQHHAAAALKPGLLQQAWRRRTAVVPFLRIDHRAKGAAAARPLAPAAVHTKGSSRRSRGPRHRRLDAQGAIAAGTAAELRLRVHCHTARSTHARPAHAAAGGRAIGAAAAAGGLSHRRREAWVAVGGAANQLHEQQYCANAKHAFARC